LGIFFTNFAPFAATADFYTRSGYGGSLVVGYALILCGEIISFFAIQELWRNIQAAKDRIREFTGLASFTLSIFLLVGCILLFYDSEEFTLIISIPPLLIADFYMVEHLFSVLGLKYVVCPRVLTDSLDILPLRSTCEIDFDLDLWCLMRLY
jgi:phosphoglycerol transferase MdoB-like AlkP superfamily enzyme